MFGFAATKLNEFEQGQISRRQLIETLTLAAATVGVAGSASAAPTGPATAFPAQAPGKFTRKRVVPAAGSYRPGIPIPTEMTRSERRTASAPTVARRCTTASGPSAAGVAT